MTEVAKLMGSQLFLILIVSIEINRLKIQYLLLFKTVGATNRHFISAHEISEITSH